MKSFHEDKKKQLILEKSDKNSLKNKEHTLVTIKTLREEKMSYTNISVADLQYEIEEKDLYVKQRELISHDEWFEQARLSLIERSVESESSLGSERSSEESESANEELQEDEEETYEHALKRSRSVLTFQSKFPEYKAECLKYMVSPWSKMCAVGEITHLNLEVHWS